MNIQFVFAGAGHSLGSRTIVNADLATSLSLPADWFEQRTGIIERRVCGEGQDVLSMAAEAITNAFHDGGLTLKEVGEETVLLHIQNGLTHLTPPAAVLVAHRLGWRNARVFGIDGVCAEPIQALETGLLLLEHGRCQRVVISASVDFQSIIDPTDQDTIGLFGSGAGAIILERDHGRPASVLKSIHLENHTEHCGLGVIPVIAVRPSEMGVSVQLGYYKMKGMQLARVALQVLPKVVHRVLDESGWTPTDIDFIASHQPNFKMLVAGTKRMNFNPAIVGTAFTHLGNIGPASLLILLSLAKQERRIVRGSKLLLVSFGLGFSCGAATVLL